MFLLAFSLAYIPSPETATMKTLPPPHASPILLPLLIVFFSFAAAVAGDPNIGVNYGEVADNLPSPEATAKLLQSTSISKLRLYGSDPAILRALSGTGISVVTGVSNADIPSLASGDPAAASWVSANIAPFVPGTTISAVSVGNEVLSYGDDALVSQLLPAMQNLKSALSAAGAAASTKVTTVHSMAVLAGSDPPSSGSFQPGILEKTLHGVLGFLNATGSPFMINPYPFFAYRSDPRPETLAFCLFQPNAGRFDAGMKVTYTNMFDAQVDAVRAALAAAGFPGLEVVVAETGWPYRGDASEVGASVENARAFNGGLVAHLRSGAGTPMSPGRSVETYIFALYDEDLKPGPASERSFGLYRPADLAPTYDAGLSSKVSSAPAAAGSSGGGVWCVPVEGATEEELQGNLDYACQQPEVDCKPINPGGECYLPSTVRSHAAYAMNELYQASGRHPWDCDFRHSATISTTSPSYNGCAYPGSQ